MINKIKAAIPLCNTNKCLSTTTSVNQGVYDNPASWCCFNDNPRHFTILNPNAHEYTMMAIDKCSLGYEFSGRRCDFAIIKGSDHFYLIEIKDTLKRAIGSTTTNKKLKRQQFLEKKQMENPIEQIENTLIYFRDQGFFDGFANKTAILCWKADPPVPAVNCRHAAAQVRFLSYGFRLYEGNSITL